MSADVVASLDRQHALLVDRIAHLQAVAARVRTTREARRTVVQLDPEEVLEVFGDRDPTEMHAALARTYLDDERFTAHGDRRAPGLAQYVHDAVLAAAAR